MPVRMPEIRKAYKTVETWLLSGYGMWRHTHADYRNAAQHHYAAVDSGLALSPNGRYSLRQGHHDGVVVHCGICRIEKKSVSATLEDLHRNGRSLWYSVPDGTLTRLKCERENARLWDVQKRKQIAAV